MISVYIPRPLDDNADPEDHDPGCEDPEGAPEVRLFGDHLVEIGVAADWLQGADETGLDLVLGDVEMRAPEVNGEKPTAGNSFALIIASLVAAAELDRFQDARPERLEPEILVVVLDIDRVLVFHQSCAVLGYLGLDVDVCEG